MEWFRIPTYPECYEINRKGEVRTLRYQGKDQTEILKQTFHVYWFVGLRVEGRTAPVPVHRLLALAFIPREDGKDYVDHINRDKTDNRIENLRWTTQTDNCLNRPARSPTPNIYYLPERMIHKYHVRINRHNKQVFFRSCLTLEDAIAARDGFLGQKS
jgi:hypothetical protein